MRIRMDNLRDHVRLTTRQDVTRPVADQIRELSQQVATNDLLIRGLRSQIAESVQRQRDTETADMVEAEITAAATAIRQQRPALTKEAAIDLTIRDNPELYRRHLAAVERSQR
jgi:hypothetical protein